MRLSRALGVATARLSPSARSARPVFLCNAVPLMNARTCRGSSGLPEVAIPRHLAEAQAHQVSAWLSGERLRSALVESPHAANSYLARDPSVLAVTSGRRIVS